MSSRFLILCLLHGFQFFIWNQISIHHHLTLGDISADFLFILVSRSKLVLDPCLKLYLTFNRSQEMVVLSGAHTIGGKGFGSPIVFYNTYFKVLLEKKPQTSSCKCMLILMPLSSDHILLTHKLFPSSLESQETTYPLKLI